MAEGVVAEHVSVAKLTQQRRRIGRADLTTDQEERRRRVAMLEHRDELRRVSGRAVVEADRHLASRGATAIGLTPAATADDPIAQDRPAHGSTLDAARSRDRPGGGASGEDGKDGRREHPEGRPRERRAPEAEELHALPPYT